MSWASWPVTWFRGDSMRTRQGSADATDAKRRTASRSSKPRTPSLNEHVASRHLAPETAYLARVPRFPDLTRKLQDLESVPMRKSDQPARQQLVVKWLVSYRPQRLCEPLHDLATGIDAYGI
jgi:hypothetical protein